MQDGPAFRGVHRRAGEQGLAGGRKVGGGDQVQGAGEAGLRPGLLGQIEGQAAGLEAKVADLDRENRELREKLAAALEAAKPPPDPATVASRIASMRELAFSKSPEWVPAAPDDILKRLTDHRRAAIQAQLLDQRRALR